MAVKVVRARIVQQVNDGEVNLTTTLDPLTPTQEFAVEAGSWRDCEPSSGEIILTGEESVINALLDKELRSVL